MFWPMVIIMALIVMIGVPVTLWWWKQADKWADAEHKRFHEKSEDARPSATVVRFADDQPKP